MAMFQRVRTSPTAGANRISIDEPLSTAPRGWTRKLMPPAWLNVSPAAIKATGNLRAVQILLGHTKIESTVRYLGVDVEDALTLAEGTEKCVRYAPVLGVHHGKAAGPQLRARNSPLNVLEGSTATGSERGFVGQTRRSDAAG
jgi:hypothetical protein